MHRKYAAGKRNGRTQQFGWLQADATKDKRSNSAATAIRGGDHELLYGLTLPLSDPSQWPVRTKMDF
jgi:hypothetical protein